MFGGSPRYNSDGEEPTVALLDNGSVIELHTAGDIYARIGVLSSSDPGGINWSSVLTKLTDGASGNAQYPASASNGAYAVGTWAGFRVSTGTLYSSVAKLP
jgi:hypothetical protein